MKLKINETARLTGITVRTLHYYDEIGLLKPSIILDNGYRLYDEENLEVLQQILFFRELEFPLNQIKTILSSRGFDKSESLQKHRELLLKKQKRLSKLIKLIDNTLKGEKEMSFKEFDITEIEKAKEKYAEEARERWGGTDAYKESEQKTAAYTPEQWETISAQTNQIFQAFAEMKHAGIPAGSEQVQEIVKQWQNCISSNFYNCTKEILSGLGSMYIQDERFTKNLDKFGEGTAEYMSQAISIYCTE